MQCFAGNQNHDAILEMSSFNKGDHFKDIKLKVEVTTNETEESVYARQQLAEYGVVHRPARFKLEDGKKVPLPPIGYDPRIVNEKAICIALERAEAKVVSGKYDRQTAILVRVETFSHLSLSDRAELVSRTKHKLGESLPYVHGVYYQHRNCIDPVRANWSRGRSPE